MKRYLTILLACCAAFAPAQEVSPEQKRDINEFLSQLFAHEISQTEKSLGDAFVTDAFVKQLNAALLTPEALHGKDDLTHAERIVAALFDGMFDSRDMDRNAVVARVNELLKERKRMLPERDMEKLAERVKMTMQVILPKRERAKEEAVLAANAKRKGVKVLSNGVQVEALPGNAALLEIDRITEETGIAYYNRTTRRGQFAMLPDAIRSVADEVPPGGAWVFWIPPSISANRIRQAEAENRAHAAAMRELVTTYEDARRDAQPKPPEPTPEAAMAHAEPLRKITVWKEGPDAPVKALPDVMHTAH